MGPELHYQLIINRVAELQREATSHRRAREAQAAKKAKQRSGERSARASFGKLRAS
ncbi:hypothetical protein [Acrocarpospora catenulata]|uniref:hypothetical protein n=1 Tax=Acrocarpospora catenulata TaxID=2836182 RepID=UPI001BD9387E|nr:hypothetical protein [Acrocarpospora catenulata]